MSSQQVTAMSSQEGQHNQSSAGGARSSGKHLPLPHLPITPVACVTVVAAATAKGVTTDDGWTVLQPSPPGLDEVKNKYR